ncbi:MAG: hypothetical protein AB9Q22_08760 [Candidatus Reddybacter sp.]
MSTQIDHDEFFLSLEEKGEDEVRALLARNIWGKTGAKFNLVHEWLRSRDDGKSLEMHKEKITESKAATEANKPASPIVKIGIQVASGTLLLIIGYLMGKHGLFS